MPTEREWVKSIIPKLQESLQNILPKKIVVRVTDGRKLPYAYEVMKYQGNDPDISMLSRYETDIMISEILSEEEWIPRVIIECKLNSVTTHDAITYSKKASTHKNVHPYLRYGILMGHRKHYPLPGRLIRHGANFDFMASWKGYKPENLEWDNMLKVLKREVMASGQLEEILSSSRSKDRKHYSILHRRLELSVL
jgi:hypothetical protein